MRKEENVEESGEDASVERLLEDFERNVEAFVSAQDSVPSDGAARAYFNARVSRLLLRQLRAFPEASADAFQSLLKP